MPYLYEYDKEAYGTLLAAEVLDASKGALFKTTGLNADTTNRTILIGVGGTGVRTIDYVKGAISKRLKPGWEKYIAFLGIDSSWTEFGGAHYITSSEQVLSTRDGIAKRMSNPATYPPATHPFMLEGEQLGALEGDGAGRTRLVGKIKIHDKAPGGLGVDEEIVNKLVSLKSSVLAPLSAGDPGVYQVYVIGSVSGGTCSGGFLEIPALVRKAIPMKCSVNAMLYLPDTLTSLDPKNAAQLKANGYATLKEFNYYMGMYMRPEYSESWSYNNPAESALTYRSSASGENFVNIPYLVGTASGDAADASETARETIAEFLISTLAKITSSNGAVFLTSAFENNATANARVGTKLEAPGTDQQEAVGEFHEFPKRFAAIGFAEASVPQKLVRAYTVGKACRKSGMVPVTEAEWTTLAATGDPTVLLPFRSAEHLMKATEGTNKAKEILKPLEKMLQIIHSGSFGLGEDLREEDITWTKIQKGQYDSATKTKANKIIEQRTSTAEMEKLKQAISKAYQDYRKNVQEYVRKEGPFAFANLFRGKFIDDGSNGMGIRKMIQNLVDGRKLDGANVNVMTPVDAENMLTDARRRIASTTPGLLGIETGKHKEQAAQWVQAYNNWGRARINDERRKVALGAHGALYELFLAPATLLADEVEAFGRVLEALGGIYQNHGSGLNSYGEFEKAQDGKTEVNLAAVDVASYDWLKRQADGTLESVNARELRDNLVDDFFGDTKKWLEIPENFVTKDSTGKHALVMPDLAVPARQVFDAYMKKEFPVTLDVSIETMFVQLKQNGMSYDQTAEAILKQLYARSQPQFNGDVPDDAKFMYIMYPNSLNKGTGEGPVIAQAISAAANNLNHGANGIQVYASDDADSIMFYQLAAPMEIYRLHDLKVWEAEYEQGLYGLKNPKTYLHGMSPDVTVISEAGKATRYVENISWADYPSITGQVDPTKPDPKTGEVSREGKLRLALRAMMKRARELGILYSEHSDKGWIVKRVHCNKSIDWTFDLMGCSPDPMTGLLPLGKDLAETVAAQNNKTLDSISRKVYLDLGGLMDKPHATEELAWEFAERTLRAHVPMFIEVRETIQMFEPWAKNIEEFNKEILKRFLPAKMVWLVKGRVLRRKDDGTWAYVQANRVEKNIAVLSPVMLKFLPPKDKYLIENGLLSYYLFGKLSAVLADQKAFDEAFERARNNIGTMAGDGDIDALTAGEEQAAALLAEIPGLAEKGARLDGDTEADPKSALVKSFPGIKDMATLKDIDLFYFRMGLWEVI